MRRVAGLAPGAGSVRLRDPSLPQLFVGRPGRDYRHIDPLARAGSRAHLKIEARNRGVMAAALDHRTAGCAHPGTRGVAACEESATSALPYIGGGEPQQLLRGGVPKADWPRLIGNKC